MTSYPWEKDVLLLTCDPASLRSAFAYSGFDAGGARVRGVFRVDDLRHASLVEENLRLLSSTCVFSKVVFVVEYPTWNAGASPVVRAAANVWIRLVKSFFPRKVEVRKVDPNVWQKTFDFRGRPSPQSTKDYSLFLALSVYKWGVETTDEADAALILEHSRAIPPAPKKVRKKKSVTP